MKIIQFLDSEHDIDAEATATSIWSVRKNGSMPTDTQYILYTVNEKHFNNPIVNKVYDIIARPPYDEEWLNSFDLNNLGRPLRDDAYFKEYRSRYKFWGKFLAFLKTPCDGSYVMHLDWDILCRSSLLGALPPKGKFWTCYCTNKWCTNGLLTKSPEFDESGIGDIMTEPLTDPELYSKIYESIPSADEIGTTWYRQTHGDSTLFRLRQPYFGNVEYYIRNNIPLDNNTDRILHYVNKTKPWQGFIPKDNPYVKLWWDVHDDMIKSI